jgi:hypothetical protein
VAGGFIAGAVFGPPDAGAFRAPVNLVLLGLVSLPGILRLAFRRNRTLGFLGGAPLAAALICFFVVFGVWMGLVPQRPPGASLQGGHDGLLASLGLFGVTASSPFVFLYLALLMSLSTSVAAGFARPRRPVFILNHFGLFLVLVGLGLGAADRGSHFMTVSEGHVEWRADGEGPELLELPVAVRLDDFDMEEYPANLALIDRATGTPLPEGRPVFYGLDGTGSQRLPGWELEILEFLPRAAPVGGGMFARAVMKASAQAALVRARQVGGGGTAEGWLSPGNAMVPPSFLLLGEDRVLVMTGPEPRRFVSRIKVFTREGLEVEREVEVNSPLTAGSWRVYQHGYDTDAGPMSVWSRFLLVEDRWRSVSRTGFLMWLLGSAGLVLSGRSPVKSRGVEAGRGGGESPEGGAVAEGPGGLESQEGPGSGEGAEGLERSESAGEAAGHGASAAPGSAAAERSEGDAGEMSAGAVRTGGAAEPDVLSGDDICAGRLS